MTDVDQKFEELENLVGALLDDQLTTKEVEQIEAMLTDDEAMREHYVHCMQLHADPHWHPRKDWILPARDQEIDSNDPSSLTAPRLDIPWTTPGSEQST